MDEPLADGALNLEEGAEITTQAVTPPVDTPPAVNATPDDPEPEGTITIPQGKVVPLGAVTAERGKRKEAEARLAAKDAEINAFREKAQRYDEASQYLEQARPIIEKIKARPDILKLADQPPAPVVEPAGPLSPQEAIEYAKDFDLYKADGTPDVDRAQRIAKRHTDMSARQAQQAISPILQTEAQRQSAALYQQYLQQPEINGVKVDPRYLAETWNSVPPEVSADPRVAQVLFMNTIGRQMLAGHKPMTAPPPVVHTESLGSNKPPATTLTKTDEAFLRSSNLPRKEFESTRESYQVGQTNSLE